jgi:hypothetical protein
VQTIKEVTDAELSGSKLNSALSLVIRFIRQWYSPLTNLLHFNMGVDTACLGASLTSPVKELKMQRESTNVHRTTERLNQALLWIHRPHSQNFIRISWQNHISLQSPNDAVFSISQTQQHCRCAPIHRVYPHRGLPRDKRRRRHTMRRNLNEHLFAATHLGSKCDRPLVNMVFGDCCLRV